MKILNLSQGHIVSQAATESPAYKFFKRVKKDLGIQWLEIKNFKITDTSYKDPVTLTEVDAKSYEKIIMGSQKGSTIAQPDYAVNIRFICTMHQGTPNIVEATIVLKSYKTNQIVAPWLFRPGLNRSQSFSANMVKTILHDELGLEGKNLETPIDIVKKQEADEIELEPINYNGQTVYYYQRLTRIKTNAYNASTLEFFIVKDKFGWSAMYTAKYLELDKQSPELPLNDSSVSLGEAIQTINASMKTARQQKNYVGPESPLYIPEGANKENWDFVLHKWKNKALIHPVSRFVQPTSEPPQPVQPVQPLQPIQTTPQPEQSEQPNVPPEQTIAPRRKPVLDLKKLFGQQQDFGGYFTGDVPDYAGSLVGTPSVDASQISSMFGGTNEAISLVNSYTSDALNNVAYIFNFSKGGAYGVYIPSLDRAIKTKALKKQLEAQGYKIVDENGVLTAHPTKKETTPEQIDKDIHSLWEQLNSGGGSALGINMADVLGATEENVSKIMGDIRQQVPDAPPQIENILRDVLGIYHLAAIILHEASHAKGGDEGKAQSDEHAFRTWAQGHLNEQYKSKLSSAGLEDFYSPLELGTEVLHAVSRSWYRTAQGIMGRLNYSPAGGAAKPQGSDIRGRYQGNWQSEGFADFAMLVQQDQSIPIEQRLNRSEMAPLEKDVDQENDIIEEQLRKQFKNDSKPNVQLITEELLSPDRNEGQGYKALETMLEELRPVPLMTPISKAASVNLIKEARYNGLFGWYNNLSISDGSTIPGLSDRVMAWDDRDESFAGEEDTVKSQPRYNPSYDLKGFYYRWIEPRFKPQLFDDMTQDYVNTTPAKRFAATLDPAFTQIVKILKIIEDGIVNEKIEATRIVASEDLMDIVKKILGHEGVNLKAYKIADSENLFAVWIYGGTVPDNSIDQAEQYFQDIDGSDQFKDLVEKLLGSKSSVTKAVEEIVENAKELCKEYKVDDLFIIGEYARKIFEGEASPFAGDLDFVCESIDTALKMGSLLANKLNVLTDYVKLGDAGITFSYNGIRVFFSRSPYYHEIGMQMMEHGYNFEDPILRDLCNKDFTINMMAYNVRHMKVIDPIGVKSDVENKIVKTLFDPSFIIEMNPLLIMRALSLRLDGYTLDEDLERTIIENGPRLKSGKIPVEKFEFARNFVRSKGMKDADALFSEYGLSEEDVDALKEI